MKVDIIIVGAGPTGLCLAYALAKAGMRIAILERQSQQAIENPAFDGREIALTHESKYLLQQWGLWPHIDTSEISDLRHAQVLNGHAAKGMYVRAELGHQNQLGWLVPNHLIRHAAYQQATSLGNIEIFYEAQIERLQTTDLNASVQLKNGISLQAQLLVAADSRFSETRRSAGIPALMKDYGKSMMVFRVQHTVDHEHIAWEWFGYGQTRALLPLNNSCASVVLTLPHQQIQDLLQLSDADFDAEIARRYEYRLGAMQRISERHVYPLVGVYASNFHATRLALIGDAAVGMHPVTAHGFNLGALSVKHLAERLIKAHLNDHAISEPRLLSAYTHAHRKSTLPLFMATNMIISLYTNDATPARFARHALLKASAAFTPFKRFVATRLTG